MVSVDVSKFDQGHNQDSRQPSTMERISDFFNIPRRRTTVYPVSQGTVHLVNYGNSKKRPSLNQQFGKS
ncbi:hypothetical protein COOONC_18383 [Cooperia oncophora]